MGYAGDSSLWPSGPGRERLKTRFFSPPGAFHPPTHIGLPAPALRLLFPLALLAIVAVACADAADVATDVAAEAAAQPTATARPFTGSLDTVPQLGETPWPTVTPTPDFGGDEELKNARFTTRGWRTDFTKRSIPLGEIVSGGPGKDGIPAIDAPVFEDIAAGDAWLDDKEQVHVVEIGGEVRAYPLAILIWHEIVNDTLGGVPVAVTYCPLCNSAITFDRRLGERTLDFGVSGLLRHSDMIMYDRQTESWWQQIVGEAIVGELLGERLTILPSFLVSWEDFKEAYPDGQVLSRDTGHRRQYGRNPYELYDRQTPFLFFGEPDKRLQPLDRVVVVEEGGDAVAFPLRALENEPVVHYTAGGRDLVVFFQFGANSALDDASVAGGRDVGAAAVYRPEVDGMRLTFSAVDEYFVDDETGSRWNLLGQAVDGQLAGKRLEPVVHGTHFWFAWAVFKPFTIVYDG